MYTPNGLKVRINTEEAFALMGRCNPESDPRKILNLTDAVYSLSSIVFFISVIVCIALRMGAYETAFMAFVSVLAMELIHLFGVFVPPFTLLIPLGKWLSLPIHMMNWLLIVASYFFIGWTGALLLVGVVFANSIVSFIIDALYQTIVKRITGKYFAYTKPERSFYHAFRLEANRIGVSKEIFLTEDEEKSVEDGRIDGRIVLFHAMNPDVSDRVLTHYEGERQLRFERKNRGI